MDPGAREAEGEMHPGNPDVRLSFTVRFPDRYLDLLDRAAAAATINPAQLAERYVIEWLEHDANNAEAERLAAWP